MGEAMDSDTEAMVDTVLDIAHMGLDMEAMEAMEDTGPTTLAKGLLILNPRLLLRLNQRQMLMPGMVDTDWDTEAMEAMVWDTVPMVDMGAMVGMVWDTVHMDLDMLVDMEAMDTDVDIASMVE